ncbi:MAG: hypothetical protein ABTR92_15900 [Candidatus Accumulibacter phosphatis]
MNWLHGTIAAIAGVLGLFIAVHHPLWPNMLGVVFVAWGLAVAWRPSIFLFVLPALLPVASFSAWTGWIGIEEFDLLVLAAVSGCHAHLLVVKAARTSHDGPGDGSEHACFRLARLGLGALAVSYAVALLRGLGDAGPSLAGWFQGYEEPLNSLRVGKSLFFALLLLPSLHRLQARSPALAASRLAAGVATGLGLVTVAIIYERSAYPGLFDFSTAYRSTALFWEMHVGGAALDGYLALAAPFAVYAVLRAPDRLRWGVAALLAVGVGYACLTSFSRGVYLGVGLSLLLLAWRLSVPWPSRARPTLLLTSEPTLPPLPPPEPWRVWGGRLLLAVLIFEALAVFGLGDFMSRRLSASERDLGSRLQHWSAGLGLLRSPSELLLGRGLGRFPANYSRAVAERAIPGRLRVIDEREAGAYLQLSAPPHSAHRDSAFELLQRVLPLHDGSYTLMMDLRAPQQARLRVAVCQRHLLYDAACSSSVVSVPGGDPQWHHFSLQFTASMPDSAGAWPPAFGFLSLRLLAGSGDAIDIDKLHLFDATGRQLLHNGDFSDGLARWFFAGRHYFVPWHIDNLFLEMLIDQGVIGLLLLLALLALAWVNLLRGPGRRHDFAPYLLAALTAFMGIGVFSSLLDMPRAAFLFFLLLCSALFLNGHAVVADPRAAPPAPVQEP